MAHYDEWLASFEFPLESVIVDAEAGRTHALVTGPEHAPPLILVHGMSSHSLFMVDLCGAPLGDRHRCFFVDVPGNPGRSEGPLPHFNDGSFGRWMREVFDGIGVERAGVVGVSMGGLAALWACAELGERVSRAAFIVPSGFVEIRPSWRLLRMIARQLILMRWPSASNARRFIAQSMRPDAIIDDRMIEAMELIFSSLRPPTLSDEAIMPKPVAAESLTGFRGPTLVVAGSEDVFFPGREVIARAKELFDEPRTLLMEDRHLGAGSSEEAVAHLLRFLSETDEVLGLDRPRR